MQRRIAAVYVAFFVVVAIAAYGTTTVAEEPSVSVEGQNYTQGQTIPAGGTDWSVNIQDGSGNLSSVNESARFTASFSNNSSVVFENGTYRPVPNGSGASETGGTTAGGASTAGTGTEGGTTSSPATTAGGEAAGATGNALDGNATSGTEFLVVIPNGSAGSGSGGNASSGNASGGNASGGNASGTATNVSSFSLRQRFDTAARLRADPSVADTTLTAPNGTQYVRYRNGTTEALGSYLPTPKSRNVSVGDRFPYRNNSSRVDAINESGVTLAWRGNLTRSQDLDDGENVTLAGKTYVAQFKTNSTVTLSRNVSGYQAAEANLEGFHERILGLWGVVIISLFAVVFLIGAAFLPVRG